VAGSFAESPEFRRLLAGDYQVNLARVALEIGRDVYPDLQIDTIVEHVKRD